MIYRIFKRLMDIIISLIALIILAIPLLFIAVWIKLDSKGPVLFKQKRVGMHKKLFTIYKFRSMRTDTPDIPTHMLENADVMITKAGHFIRKTSIDELPQLLNILKGDMSIIGPRPALYNQDDLVAERDKYNVHSVRPGLSGWAQVNGRDELPIPVKAKLDGEYIEHFGLWMDIKSFFMTFSTVFTKKGYKDGK